MPVLRKLCSLNVSVLDDVFRNIRSLRLSMESAPVHLGALFCLYRSQPSSLVTVLRLAMSGSDFLWTCKLP